VVDRIGIDDDFSTVKRPVWLSRRLTKRRSPLISVGAIEVDDITNAGKLTRKALQATTNRAMRATAPTMRSLEIHEEEETLAFIRRHV
jgi:hypothetical protein